MRKHLKANCAACKDIFFYSPTRKTVPKYCLECSEKKKTKWHVEHCKICNIPINICEDWPYIHKFCSACNEREKEKEKTKLCSCGNPITYKDDWDHIPNFCKRCREKFNNGWITTNCEECRVEFRWNRQWLDKDEQPPICCSKCQKKKHHVFIEEHQSYTVYELITRLDFYHNLNQIDHFIRGSTDLHRWTGEFSNADPQQIIDAAAKLAESIEEGVIEIKDRVNNHIIKYDSETKLVVIFNKYDREIITAYLIRHGIQYIINKVTKGDWIKV
jgi:hypothetical protein